MAILKKKWTVESEETDHTTELEIYRLLAIDPTEEKGYYRWHQYSSGERRTITEVIEKDNTKWYYFTNVKTGELEFKLNSKFVIAVSYE